MPLMTEPLAHLEMLLSETKAKIEALEIERITVATKANVLNEQRYAIAKVLDEERAKLKGESV